MSEDIDHDHYDEDDDLVYDDDLVGELELIGDQLTDDDDFDGDDIDTLLALLDDDEDDEIGALRRAGRRRRARPRKGKMAKLALLARAIRGAPVVTRPAQPRVARRPRRRGRTLPLGGQATQGPTAGQLLISTTVQEQCRVDRLFVVGRDENGLPLNPAAYSIADIKVGTKSQFAALPPLPGTMFATDATGHGRSLGLDTIQTGTDFTVIIADAPAQSSFTWGAFARAVR